MTAPTGANPGTVGARKRLYFVEMPSLRIISHMVR
jgi:hypothetical protein